LVLEPGIMRLSLASSPASSLVPAGQLPDPVLLTSFAAYPVIPAWFKTSAGRWAAIPMIRRARALLSVSHFNIGSFKL